MTSRCKLCPRAPSMCAAKAWPSCTISASTSIPNEIIDQLYPILKRRKIPVVSGPETLVVAGNRSVSFLDPDGNRVEIACNANKFRFDNRMKPAPPRRDRRR